MQTCPSVISHDFVNVKLLCRLSGPAEGSRKASLLRVHRGGTFFALPVCRSAESSILPQHRAGMSAGTVYLMCCCGFCLFPTFLLSRQVDLGVPHLCKVLKEVNEQRQSKSWYLLRARTLQTCSSYLCLDTAALLQAQRGQITQHGELEICVTFSATRMWR